MVSVLFGACEFVAEKERRQTRAEKLAILVSALSFVSAFSTLTPSSSSLHD